jgi:hypothetical protein
MERELNYLVLRYLESYLEPEDFEKVKEKVRKHPPGVI